MYCMLALAEMLMTVSCDYRTQGEVKAVAHGLINDVDQDAVCYAKLAWLNEVDMLKLCS